MSKLKTLNIEYSTLTYVYLLLAGLFFFFLFLQPFPVLHDLLEWMYQAWIVNQLLLGDLETQAKYVFVAYPVPNSLSQISIAIMSFIVSPILATKIWLGMYLALVAFVANKLWQRTADATQVLLIVVLIFLGPGFWNGYINNQFALVLFALYFVGYTQDFTKTKFKTLLFSILIFSAHAVVFAVFFLMVVMPVLLSKEHSLRQKFNSLLPMLPASLLMSWYTLVRLFSYEAGSSTAMGLLNWIQYKVYTIAKQGPFHNFILDSGESLLSNLHWFYQFGFAVNFLFVVFIGLWFITLVFKKLKSDSDIMRRGTNLNFAAVMISLGFCALIFFMAGSMSFGVVNLGERFLIVGLLIMLMSFTMNKYLAWVKTGFAALFSAYFGIATFYLSDNETKIYQVARSDNSEQTQEFVKNIYANSRHKYFNHRLFIYVDRGVALSNKDAPLLDIAFDTSVVTFKQENN